MTAHAGISVSDAVASKVISNIIYQSWAEYFTEKECYFTARDFDRLVRNVVMKNPGKKIFTAQMTLDELKPIKNLLSILRQVGD